MDGLLNMMANRCGVEGGRVIRTRRFVRLESTKNNVPVWGADRFAAADRRHVREERGISCLPLVPHFINTYQDR